MCIYIHITVRCIQGWVPLKLRPFSLPRLIIPPFSSLDPRWNHLSVQKERISNNIDAEIYIMRIYMYIYIYVCVYIYIYI